MAYLSLRWKQGVRSTTQSTSTGRFLRSIVPYASPDEVIVNFRGIELTVTKEPQDCNHCNVGPFSWRKGWVAIHGFRCGSCFEKRIGLMRQGYLFDFRPVGYWWSVGTTVSVAVIIVLLGSIGEQTTLRSMGTRVLCVEMMDIFLTRGSYLRYTYRGSNLNETTDVYRLSHIFQGP